MYNIHYQTSKKYQKQHALNLDFCKIMRKRIEI